MSIASVWSGFLVTESTGGGHLHPFLWYWMKCLLILQFLKLIDLRWVLTMYEMLIWSLQQPWRREGVVVPISCEGLGHQRLGDKKKEPDVSPRVLGRACTQPWGLRVSPLDLKRISVKSQFKPLNSELVIIQFRPRPKFLLCYCWTWFSKKIMFRRVQGV